MWPKFLRAEYAFRSEYAGPTAAGGRQFLLDFIYMPGRFEVGDAIRQKTPSQTPNNKWPPKKG
jgi:hypothetical protein